MSWRNKGVNISFSNFHIWEPVLFPYKLGCYPPFLFLFFWSGWWTRLTPTQRNRAQVYHYYVQNCYCINSTVASVKCHNFLYSTFQCSKSAHFFWWHNESQCYCHLLFMCWSLAVTTTDLCEAGLLWSDPPEVHACHFLSIKRKNREEKKKVKIGWSPGLTRFQSCAKLTRPRTESIKTWIGKVH